MSGGGTAARVVENPFLVLGLAPTATRMEIEREAGKLLGMLELGLAAAATYATPLGPRPRTPELVRTAAATLRDPARRLAAEVWARAAGAVPGGDDGGGEAGAGAAAPGPAVAPEQPRGWPGAPLHLGWRNR